MNIEIENTPTEEPVETKPEGLPEDESPEVTGESPEEVKETSTEEPEATEDTEKLILGKYKTTEDLVNAHLSLQKDYTQTKQALKDPQYVYELARSAGLTNEEAQDAAAGNNVDINQVVSQQIANVRDYEKAIEILPDLAKDPALETWARGLVDGGMSHQQAANFIKGRLNDTQEVAKAEGAKAKEVEISAKEAAQTAPTVGSVDSDASEMESLKTKAKSLNRKEQEDALIELELKKNRG